MFKLSKTLISSTLIVSALILTGTVFAKDSDRGKGATQSGAFGQKFEHRLENAKLKSCQSREAGLKKRSDQLTKMAINMENKFDSIAKRAENFYTNKILPSGKTVPSYDSLVSDIAAKKALVDAALSKAQTDVSGFSCDGSDPKGQMTQFRQDMQSVKKALKEYRTSIKNLIVAVHSVTGKEAKESTVSAGTRSPKPGESEGVEK